MSDVLVRNTKMPDCCNHCFYVRFCGPHALTVERLRESVHEQIFDLFGEMRLKDCPLVEVKPHGKLKDFNDILTIFDNVIHDVDDKTNALLCDLLVQIQYAPTVLEASDGE